MDQAEVRPAIVVGSDHAGFEVKEMLKEYLTRRGLTVEDVGPESAESCDYPDFARQVALRVAGSPARRGVLVCGTGIGMSITANRMPGIRAALCHDRDTAEMSRRHNDANVLCIGARVLDRQAIEEIVAVWLETPYEGGRHARRLQKIDEP